MAAFPRTQDLSYVVVVAKTIPGVSWSYLENLETITPPVPEHTNTQTHIQLYRYK